MTGLTERHNLRDNLSAFKALDHAPSRPPPFSPQSRHVDETDNVDYHFEEARLRSFDSWPVPFMDKKKLAEAGFYYTGEGDKVRCFECRVDICQWQEGDDPMTDHQRWSSRCRFIRKIPCGNVPLGVDPATIPAPVPRSRDVCGPYAPDLGGGGAALGSDCAGRPVELDLPSTAKLGSLGLGRPKGPMHPEYASHEARLATFESWPKSMPQTREKLADAGFYYTGKGDQTLCYHCGGGLKDWEPEDDPWEQHAKWFSKCYYLLTVKGQQFVNRVTGQNVPPPTKEEMMAMNLPSYIRKVEQPAAVQQKVEERTGDDSGPSSAEGNGSRDDVIVAASAASGPEAVASASTAVASTESRPRDDATAVSKSPESKPLDDARMCKICYNEELGVVFLPCGHMIACVKCAPYMTSCALCRQSVSMIVRAFFS